MTRISGACHTKVCVAADGHGKALSFTLSSGQAHELPSAYALLDDLPHPPTYVVCDRRYVLHKFREYLWDRGSRPVIPPRKNNPEVVCPKWVYRHRHLVENLWTRLKEWRAVATRYEKTAASSSSLLQQTISWPKQHRTLPTNITPIPKRNSTTVTADREGISIACKPFYDAPCIWQITVSMQAQ